MSRYLKTPLGEKSVIPERIDVSTLCPIPRSISALRSSSRFVLLPMKGHDIWNCYELSWLNEAGIPVSGMCQLTYSSDSPYLVESKSLKLYLGSYFDTHFMSGEEVSDRIQIDLSNVVGSKVEIKVYPEDSWNVLADQPPLHEWNVLLPETKMPDLRGILEVHEEIAHEKLVWNSFRSLCPVTAQPDWASIFIDYSGTRLRHDSLLGYLMKYRMHASFHEEACEQIYADIYTAASPQALFVGCNFLRRGGIDINPIRFSVGYTGDVSLKRHLRQ